MKLTIVYYDKGVKTLDIDHTEWNDRCPDNILRIKIHYPDRIKILERADGYICHTDEDGLVWFGCLDQQLMTGNKMNKTFQLEEMLKMPIKFGKWVSNEDWTEANTI